LDFQFHGLCCSSFLAAGASPKRYKTATVTPNPEVTQAAVALHADLIAETHAEAAYSNPQQVLRLSMPSIHSHLPIDRFRLHEKRFHFMGRIKFAELLSTLRDVYATDGAMTLDVYGTVGSGKVRPAADTHASYSHQFLLNSCDALCRWFSSC
jgi:hypothetical protein